MGSLPQVLFVCKPVEPPWNDSSKNLVRDLAAGLTKVSPSYLDKGASRFAPGVLDKARSLGFAMRRPGGAGWHFFFAPNPTSSAVGKVVTGIRRLPSVHTVCSAPMPETDLASCCFADVTVALSKSTMGRLQNAGMPEARIRRIPPCVSMLHPPSEAQRRTWRSERNVPLDVPVLIFPGDVEVGQGAPLSVRAFAALAHRDAHLIVACRPKTDRAAALERDLRELCVMLGVADRVRFVGDTRDIHTWLALSDVVLLPTMSLYAKMDYPLVLLEAMQLGRPVVVAAGTPAAELAAHGAQVVPPSVGAVASSITDLLDDDERRAQIGRDSARSVNEHFSVSAIARQYESLYRDLGVLNGD